eukprot:jgi/Tetstr1/464931/TSEL_009665.t1
METLRAPNATIRTKKDALDPIDTVVRTFAALGDTHEAQVTYYLRRFKVKKAVTGEEQVPARLIYSRVFGPAEQERSANVVDGLLAALEHKRAPRDDFSLFASSEPEAPELRLRVADLLDDDMGLRTAIPSPSGAHGSGFGQRVAGQPTGNGGAAERPDLLELAQSGRVGAKSVSAEDD